MHRPDSPVAETVAFSTADVLTAMQRDSVMDLGNMIVGGGMTANSFFVQLHADDLGVDVLRACMPSRSGLLTTIGYKLGADAQAVLALEGSVACAGRAVLGMRPWPSARRT